MWSARLFTRRGVAGGIILIATMLDFLSLEVNFEAGVAALVQSVFAELAPNEAVQKFAREFSRVNMDKGERESLRFYNLRGVIFPVIGMLLERNYFIGAGGRLVAIDGEAGRFTEWRREVVTAFVRSTTLLYSPEKPAVFTGIPRYEKGSCLNPFARLS